MLRERKGFEVKQDLTFLSYMLIDTHGSAYTKEAKMQNHLQTLQSD